MWQLDFQRKCIKRTNVEAKRDRSEKKGELWGKFAG
jgi:hypothetical protein